MSYTVMEVQAEIAAHGEAQERLGQMLKSQGQIEASQKCFNRARVTRDEKMLLWSNVEASDPEYAMENQGLCTAPLISAYANLTSLRRRSWDLTYKKFQRFLLGLAAQQKEKTA